MAELSSTNVYGNLTISGLLKGTYLRLSQANGGNESASLIELGNRKSDWTYGINFNAYYDGSWKYRSSDYGASIGLDNDGSLLMYVNASGTADSAFSWSNATYIKLLNNGNVGINKNPLYKLDVEGDVNIASSSKYKINGTNLNVVAGNGLTGGGDFAPGATITLGTPGTLTSTTTNAVSTSSHTHSISGFAISSHTHSNLVAGNGISGTTYDGGTTQTWNIYSHAGSAGSIGTLYVSADQIGVNLGTTSITAFRGDYGQAAYDHISSNGTSHTYIDQDVRTTANPTFNTLTSVLIGKDTAALKYIVSPSGAKYTNEVESITGAIRIILPKRRSNTMMFLTIKIFNFNWGQGESFTLNCGGYNRSTGGWYGTFAYVTGQTDTEYTVRFGENSTNSLIYIGEVSTNWSYPRVVVTDVVVGYYDYATGWESGWAIDVVTSFDTVAATITSTLPYSDWNKIKNKPSTFPPEAHALVSSTHTASGLQVGHFLKATSATQFSFAAHGLTYTDVGAPPTSRTITAGNGLTGGGDLSANRTITLGTPGTLTSTTTNAVTTSSHTHSVSGFVITGRNITAGNGLTGGGDLTADRTLTLGTPSTLTGATTNAVTTSSHTHAITLTASDVGAAPTVHNHGTGTTGKLPKWNDTAGGLGNSIIQDYSTYARVSGSFVVENNLEGIISNESLLNNFISGEGWRSNNLILYSAKNRLALAHKKYTVTTTPAVNIDNVFLPGDTTVKISSDKLPLTIEILGTFSYFSSPGAYRPYVFMHEGYFSSIKFEIKGANGQWYVIDDVSNNTSMWWVGSTNSVLSYPFSGVRFTFNNASGSPVYLRELGFFHPRSEPWTQYIMAQGDSIYGSLNFSGVDSDIITPAGEHLAIMPGTGGNVGIKTTNPAYTLDVNGDVNIASGSKYKINGTNLNVVAGNGLTGGGDFAPGATITLGTPGTLTSTTTNAVTTSSHTHSVSGFVITGRNITAGSGLTGGGDLSADRTITLGTPGTLTASTSNAVSTSSHTHSISGFAATPHALVGSDHSASGLTAGHFLKATSATQFGFAAHGLTYTDVGAPPTSRTITAGNGLTGGGDLSANRTITLGTPGTLTSTTTNAVTASSHTHAISGFAPYEHFSSHVQGYASANYIPKFSADAEKLQNTSAPICESGSNIGIGTTLPLYKLDVNGTINASTAFSCNGSTGITSLITLVYSASLTVVKTSTPYGNLVSDVYINLSTKTIRFKGGILYADS